MNVSAPTWSVTSSFAASAALLRSRPSLWLGRLSADVIGLCLFTATAVIASRFFAAGAKDPAWIPLAIAVGLVGNFLYAVLSLGVLSASTRMVMAAVHGRPSHWAHAVLRSIGDAYEVVYTAALLPFLAFECAVLSVSQAISIFDKYQGLPIFPVVVVVCVCWLLWLSGAAAASMIALRASAAMAWLDNTSLERGWSNTWTLMNARRAHTRLGRTLFWVCALELLHVIVSQVFAQACVRAWTGTSETPPLLWLIASAMVSMLTTGVVVLHLAALSDRLPLGRATAVDAPALANILGTEESRP